MPYLRAPTYRVIRVTDSAGRWRPDFEGKKSCSREMEMDELEPAMEDVGMGWSRVTEQDGAVYYWHEASEQSRWEPPPHSTPNGCGGARLGHRMCEGCGAKQAGSLCRVTWLVFRNTTLFSVAIYALDGDSCASPDSD